MIRYRTKDNQIVEYAGIVYIALDTPGEGNVSIKYIGKTTRKLESRLGDHINNTDSKFGVYIRVNRNEIASWQIVEILIPNKTDLGYLEKGLIQEYKPELNIAGTDSGLIELPQTSLTIEGMNQRLNKIRETYQAVVYISSLKNRLPKTRGLNGVAKSKLINRINAAIEELTLIKAELEAIETRYIAIKHKNGNMTWIPEQ